MMKKLSVSGCRVGTVSVAIAISALVFWASGPGAGDTLTHGKYLALMPSLAAQAPPPNYTYTVIADVTNCFNVGSTVLNNGGEAAFVANCGAPIGPPGGAVVVRRGDGSGPLADIFTSGPSSTVGVGTLPFP